MFKNNCEVFTEKLQKTLVSILSAFDCHELPTPQNFQRLIITIANFHFIRKPATTITDIHSGVPSQHMGFWTKITGGMLYEIYTAMLANTSKVLSIIADVEPMNPIEERVLSYLRQYIGNLHGDKLFTFLRFVTGCPVCTTNPNNSQLQ